MPRIRGRFQHPWFLALPATALFCAATATPPHHGLQATLHPAMQPAAVPAQAPAAPTLASTARPPARTAHTAPAVAAGAPRAATPADEGPGQPARVLLWSDPVWATSHVLYADSLGTCIACTSTREGPNRSSSEARSSRVLNAPVSEGRSASNGASSGELIALPPNPLLRLALEPWRTSGTATETSSSGHAQAAVVELGLVRPGLLDIEVARASSDSRFSTRSGPTATSSEDVLAADIGGGVFRDEPLLRIVVLHSEASDRGDSSAQLASVNGTVLYQSGKWLPDRFTVAKTVTFELLHGNDDGEGAAAAVVQDSRSQNSRSEDMVGLNSGATGGNAKGPAEPLH